MRNFNIMAKSGDDLEKIVELIERSISPGSIIRQNVKLPVLTSQVGSVRQCDVVIESGPEFRRSMTIVEVQDRKSQVNIGAFNDWLQKLDDVGANCLICISRKEFPESVKEIARFHGQRVLLINLKEAMPDSLPLNFLSFYVKYENVSITDISCVSCCIEKGSVDLSSIDTKEIQSHEKIWSRDKLEKLSIVEVLSPLIKELHLDFKGAIEGVAAFTFESDRRLVLYVFINGRFIRVGVNIKVNYTYDNHFLPMTVSSYEQINHGVLAWVFEIEHITSDGKIKTKIPVVKHGENAYRMLDVINSTDFSSQVTVKDLGRKPIL